MRPAARTGSGRILRWMPSTARAARTPAAPPAHSAQAAARRRSSPRQQIADPQPRQAADQGRADPARGGRHEQPRLAQPLDDGEEHRRQEDAEQRHADHATEHGDPQRPPHLRPGARGHGQRDHADDERQRGHQDRPQPQPARLHASPRPATSPRRCFCLAYSTIRIAFLHARPTSTTRPICTKMLTSRPVHSTPASEQSRHIGTTRITASGSDQLSYSAARARKTLDDRQREDVDARCSFRRPDLQEHQLGPLRPSSTAAGSRRSAR